MVLNLLRTILTSPLLAPVWRPLMRGRATILMLHRFADPELGVKGHDPALLETNLRYLREHRYHLASLQDLVARLASGEPPLPRTVVFTVDDGYGDFGRIAAPIFARYDCPATSFLVTAFTDGTEWIWYDAVGYLIGDEPRGALELPVGHATLRLRWNSHEEREAMTDRLCEALKWTSTTAVELALRDLSALTGRKLPAQIPPHLAPMSWDEIRAWSARGMSFGPHTHTHPILSRTDPVRAADEVRRSWQRLRDEVSDPVPVFCYPNGMHADFGTREQELVRESGLIAGVAASGGACALGDYRRNPFALPRAAYDADPVWFRQVVGGLDRAVTLLESTGG